MPDNEPYEPLKMQLAARNGIDGVEARDFAASERGKMVEFLRDCDVAILDAQYTDEEYQKHIGWGHSSLSSVVSLALDADVGQLVLFHHDPSHDDEMIDRMVEQARSLVPSLPDSAPCCLGASLAGSSSRAASGSGWPLLERSSPSTPALDC